MSIKITKVLLLDNVDPSAKSILEKNGIQATLSKEKFTPAALIKELQAYDGVVIRSATKITSEIIEQCPNLKIIGRAGVGVDNIDIASATKHGIVVMNTPSGNTISAAEHTCTLICCLSRNVPAADASMKAGKWDRKAFMGHELYGKTLGVVGLGRIGREAAIRMQSFGMTTIGFDPLVSKEEAAKSNIEWLTLEEIWPRADYITVHTPLIPQTRGLLNDDSFAKCKKGVRVINCARGGIIDEAALLRALESGQCGGAGLDVYVEEPATNHDLVKHPKVVACPHLGASTTEGQSRCGKEIAEQFAAVSTGKSFFGVLNAPGLTQASGMEDWIKTLTSIGKIVKQFASGPSTVVITSHGKSMSNVAKCLNAAFCAGFLRSGASSVNLINASAIAKDRGINVTVSNASQSTDAAENFCNVELKNEILSIKLTVAVSNGNGYLVSMDNCKFTVPIPICGNLVLCKSEVDNMTSILGSLEKLGAKVSSLSTTSVSNGLRWMVFVLSDNIGVENINCNQLQNPISVSL